MIVVVISKIQQPLNGSYKKSSNGVSVSGSPGKWLSTGVYKTRTLQDGSVFMAIPTQRSPSGLPQVKSIHIFPPPLKLKAPAGMLRQHLRWFTTYNV